MHAVGCLMKSDLFITRGMQGACAVSGVVKSAGKKRLLCDSSPEALLLFQLLVRDSGVSGTVSPVHET